MSLRLITAPTAQPVTLLEGKAHLRLVTSDDDTLVAALLIAATEAAEHATGRALMAQTWEAGFDAFSAELVLTRVPVQSVTSVTYIGESGTLQTLSSLLYTLTKDDFGFARITPAYGSSWPQLRGDVDGVKVRYVAGYTSAADVPQSIKSWMLLHCGSQYANRESETVGSGSAITLVLADALLHRYKVYAA
jgi:uncharacterized phiE125 gp8 family phage protein